MSPSRTPANPHRVARHTALNLIGQGLPALAGLATVPILLHGLGKEAYGAFSLAWAVLGYFSLVDLGLGRATTRFVAEYVARGQGDSLRDLVRTSLLTQGLLGLLGAGILALLVPWLVGHVFRIPPVLVSSVTAGFLLLAATLPFLLVSANLVGVLEGLRHFGALNGVRIPASLAVLILPAVAVARGAGFLGAVAAVVVARLFGALVLGLVVHRVLPPRGQTGRSASGMVRSLLSFGGWITVSNVASPVMVYFDRFVIGSRVDLSAVSYYSAPYDVVTRLLLIPSSLVSVLFPEFSALSVAGDRSATERLIIRSSRALLGGMGLFVVLTMPLVSGGLSLWLGPDFAAAATWPTRLLLIGTLINGLAWIPFAYLQGGGRPDLPAKAHLIELPLYLVLLWWLTGWFGITGTATAWLIRVTLDAAFLFGFSVRLGATSAARLARRLAPCLALVAAAGLIGTTLARALPGWLMEVAGVVVSLGLYVCVGWLLLDREERQALRGLLARLRRLIAPREVV